jgi:rRNA maturation RNase YbeY
MLFSSIISFHSEGLDFELDNPDQISNWIKGVIDKEGKETGEITYIFCSDEYLHKVNMEHLNHDTYTDIITFNYCENNLINSDIFISIDRVKENAKQFNSSFFDELCRVIIHGILHLIGYDDKTSVQQKEMRAKEDFYLSLRPEQCST